MTPTPDVRAAWTAADADDWREAGVDRDLRHCVIHWSDAWTELVGFATDHRFNLYSPA